MLWFKILKAVSFSKFCFHICYERSTYLSLGIVLCFSGHGMLVFNYQQSYRKTLVFKQLIKMFMLSKPIIKKHFLTKIYQSYKLLIHRPKSISMLCWYSVRSFSSSLYCLEGVWFSTPGY